MGELNLNIYNLKEQLSITSRINGSTERNHHQICAKISPSFSQEIASDKALEISRFEAEKPYPVGVGDPMESVMVSNPFIPFKKKKRCGNSRRDTPRKFNIAPENRPKPKRNGSSSKKHLVSWGFLGVLPADIWDRGESLRTSTCYCFLEIDHPNVYGYDSRMSGVQTGVANTNNHKLCDPHGTQFFCYSHMGIMSIMSIKK